MVVKLNYTISNVLMGCITRFYQYKRNTYLAKLDTLDLLLLCLWFIQSISMIVLILRKLNTDRNRFSSPLGGNVCSVRGSVIWFPIPDQEVHMTIHSLGVHCGVGGH